MIQIEQVIHNFKTEWNDFRMACLPAAEAQPEGRTRCPGG